MKKKSIFFSLKPILFLIFYFVNSFASSDIPLLVKNGSLNPALHRAAVPGDTISYAFQVRNPFSYPLTNVRVTDSLVASINCAGGLPIAVLQPGEVVVCTGSYAITQADISAGWRCNTATATSDQTGPVIASDSVQLKTDTTSVYISNSTKNPQFTIYKTNGELSLYYDIPAGSPVSVHIYTMQGRLVASVVNRFQKQGPHRIRLDAARSLKGCLMVCFKAGNTRINRYVIVTN